MTTRRRSGASRSRPGAALDRARRDGAGERTRARGDAGQATHRGAAGAAGRRRRAWPRTAGRRRARAGIEAPDRSRRAASTPGWCVNAVTPTSLRFAPPLLVTDDEIDRGVAILAAVLQEVARERRARFPRGRRAHPRRSWRRCSTRWTAWKADPGARCRRCSRGGAWRWCSRSRRPGPATAARWPWSASVATRSRSDPTRSASTSASRRRTSPARWPRTTRSSRRGCSTTVCWNGWPRWSTSRS